mgnify:CR=1 FL=1
MGKSLYRRRVEARFLRSDGRPNFSERIYERELELAVLSKRPVVTLSQRAPIREAIRTIIENNFRRIPITMPDKRLMGIVTATDLVNYFGGGDYFKIIMDRHEGDLFSALDEPLESIMKRDVIKASLDESFVDVLEKMIINYIGSVPIVDEENRVYGIITERDILRHLADKITGRKVEEIMSRDVITASPATIVKDAAQTMISLGFRRLPVLDEEKIIGIVVTTDIVKLFQPKIALKYSARGSVYDLIKTPLSEIMSSPVITVKPDVEIGEVAKIMMENGIGALPVIEDDKLVGIITERDLLYDIVLKERE